MKLNKRSVALLISLAVLLTAAVGATLAYILDKTDPVVNSFTPSRVACEVTENGDVYTVSNTGDTQCYVRVAVVVTQQNNGVISAVNPKYAITPGDNWKLGTDGYYYYTKPLAVGEDTLGITVTVTAADGYTASVEIVASAIQATSDAVSDWSGGVATAATDGAVLTVQYP
jgi:hypothetical protein